MMKSTMAGALLLLTACAARAKPAERFIGQVPLQVTVRGSLYTGTATVTRTTGDQVSGTFTIAGPVEVKGTLTGHVGEKDVQLDLNYNIAANGCKGTMRLTGPATNAASLVEGAAEAQDSCVGRMTGTFKLGLP
jgi:hypothetical protein